MTDWATKRSDEMFDYFIAENAIADHPSLFIDIKAALVRELRKAKADGMREAAEIVRGHFSKKVQTDNTYYEGLAIGELLEAAASKLSPT